MGFCAVVAENHRATLMSDRVEPTVSAPLSSAPLPADVLVSAEICSTTRLLTKAPGTENLMVCSELEGEPSKGSPSSQRKGQNWRSNRSALLLTPWSASCGSPAIGSFADLRLRNPLGGAGGPATRTGKTGAESGLQCSRDVSPSRTAYFVSSAALCRSSLLMICCRWVSMVLALTCRRAAICLAP